jgi:hypothetical protein
MIAYELVFLLASVLVSFTTSVPKAFVHIGPAKTASSTIQAFLEKNADHLKKDNLRWPHKSDGTMFVQREVGNFARNFKEINTTNLVAIAEMKAFIKNALHDKANIIISAEALCDADVGNILAMKPLLDGFEVTIVFVYRQWLSHLISVHNQRNKDGAVSQPFSTFLLASMDKISIGEGINPIRDNLHISRYATVYGLENITIIDMVGAIAAKVPIEKVVVCDVAKVWCSRNEEFAANPSANVHVDLVLVVLRTLFAARSQLLSVNAPAAKQLRCRSTRMTCDKQSDFIAAEYAAQQAKGDPLPLVKSKVSLLVPHAKKHDIDFREKFGHRMLYANQTANFLDMEEHIHVEELDVQRILSSAKWLLWMDGLVKKASSLSVLCDC